MEIRSDRARRKAEELAFERLPDFLRTSPLEVLVGIAVTAIGIVEGGLTGSALVGLGVLLVAWTTATGLSSARTAAAVQAAERARLSILARQLAAVDDEIAAALASNSPEVREALLQHAQRAMSQALAEAGGRPDAVNSAAAEPAAPALPPPVPAATPQPSPDTQAVTEPAQPVTPVAANGAPPAPGRRRKPKRPGAEPAPPAPPTGAPAER